MSFITKLYILSLYLKIIMVKYLKALSVDDNSQVREIVLLLRYQTTDPNFKSRIFMNFADIARLTGLSSTTVSLFCKNYQRDNKPQKKRGRRPKFKKDHIDYLTS